MPTFVRGDITSWRINHKTAIKITEKIFVFVSIFIRHFSEYYCTFEKEIEFLVCFENSLQKFTETYFAPTGEWYF